MRTKDLYFYLLVGGILFFLIIPFYDCIPFFSRNTNLLIKLLGLMGIIATFSSCMYAIFKPQSNRKNKIVLGFLFLFLEILIVVLDIINLSRSRM
jgi:hypothetical protein